MPQKLSEGDVADVRARAREGYTLPDIAAEFDVSVRHVRRILDGSQRQTLGELGGLIGGRSVADATEVYLDGLRLEDEGLVLGEVALALSAKLDAVRDSDAAAAAGAAAGIARELGAILGQLSADDQRARGPSPLDAIRARRDSRLAALQAGAGQKLYSDTSSRPWGGSAA